jgi:hypothetical protein
VTARATSEQRSGRTLSGPRAPGTRTLVILGRKPTAKPGLAVAEDNTVDVGDVIVDEQPK